MVLTNAEKYLKDGVNVEEFIDQLHCFWWENEYDVREGIRKYLNAKAPALTEDERVILRNIDNYRYEKIKRVKGILVLFNVFTKENEETPFAENLFQFIKERRRI